MAEMKEVMENLFGDAGKPLATYKITFDSPQDQLGPIYYWILDFIEEFQGGKWAVEKITDNFVSTPGSGQFADMTQKLKKQQDDAMYILGAMNQVIKSVLNLIYDLKEFEVRLSHYEDANSDDKKEMSEGILALKQIWLDSVDIKRGRGSIHQMAMELGFTTIREAFMMANSTEDLEKMNDEDGGALINDQVLRVLIPRTNEFLTWVEYSEKELRKRMNIEKSYLKSQVETIKLYSSWIRPYLKAAKELKQQGFEGNAALVNALSTSMFELTILAKKPQKLPDYLEDKYNLKREYYSCVMVNFKYRGHVSQRATQRGDYGFAMGGKVDMTFDSFVFNSEELELIEKEMKKEDTAESYDLAMDSAADALEEFKEDLDHFLNDDFEEKKKEKKDSEDTNPFTALFEIIGWFKKDKKKKGEKKDISSKKDIKKDNYYEKYAREEAEKSAHLLLYTVYDIYKKAHGMASSGDKMENWEG